MATFEPCCMYTTFSGLVDVERAAAPVGGGQTALAEPRQLPAESHAVVQRLL